MPTWFIHRSKLQKFSEEGTGTPEDLLFFYKHLRNGGKVKRVDEKLVFYRYHPSNTTFSIKSETIWNVKLHFFIEDVLEKVLTLIILKIFMIVGNKGRIVDHNFF